MSNELPGLPVAVSTVSLGLVKFGWKFAKKNKSFVEEVESFQKTVINEKASRKVVDKELAQLRSSVAAYDVLTAKLMEFEKSLEAVCAEGVSSKGQVTLADAEKADFNRVVVEDRKYSKQFLVRLNAVLVGLNRLEDLTRSLVMKWVNASMLYFSSLIMMQ